MGAPDDWVGARDPWPRIVVRIRARWPDQFSDEAADRYRTELSNRQVGALEYAVQSWIADGGSALPSANEFKDLAIPPPPPRPGRPARETEPRQSADEEQRGEDDEESQSFSIWGLLGVLALAWLVVGAILYQGFDVEMPPVVLVPGVILLTVVAWRRVFSDSGGGGGPGDFGGGGDGGGGF